MTPSRHLAIAGGGASGLLLVRAALAAGARVTIVEPSERLGTGVAYATTCPVHLLNAPASAMSAVYDDPAHFTDWLARNGFNAAPSDFVPRATYGRYLDGVAAGVREAGDRFRHIRSTVDDLGLSADGVHMSCANGEQIDADAAVVAVGNAEPSPWPRVSTTAEASLRYFRSAWVSGATTARSPEETVVLLGTGLTAIDATLGLRDGGHRGQIVMISRRGLLPHEHRLFDAPPATAPDAETLRDVIRALRVAGHGGGTSRGWRGALDGMRSQTNARWRALSLDDQRRIVRHVLPYWNVHRHRIAPAATKMVADLIASNTLRMLAGRTEEIVEIENGLRVTVRLRGSTERVAVDAGRVINCSGPQHDITALPNPLIRRLIERGYVVPHPLGIGAKMTNDGAFIGAGGRPSDRLYAIGPVRFGTLIETTAIPEIRAQAHELATLLVQERGAESSSIGSSAPSTTFGTR